MWTRFEPSSVEDETVTNAFCTNGLFKIGYEGDDPPPKHPPAIQSLIQNEKMVVAVEQNLFLLQAENFSEANTMEFQSKIDCLTTTPDGNIIVCCLSDGSLIGCHIDGKALFNLSIPEEDLEEDPSGGSSNKDSCFAGINFLEGLFYVVTVQGKLYRLSNVNLESLSETLIKTQNDGSDDTLLSNVVLEIVVDVKRDQTITSFIMVKLLHSIWYLSMVGRKLSLFEVGKGEVEIYMPKWLLGLKQIYNLDNYLIGLTDDGKLVEICLWTELFMKFGENDYQIDELVVLENNYDEIELLLITKPDECSKRTVKIVSFPSMACKNELYMDLDTWLVVQPKGTLNMYYLSGIRDEVGNFCEIEMKAISETEPLQRLKKLIQKELFEEAEEFAKQFELDVHLVFEAKARKLCDEIAFNQAAQINEKFTELYQLLEAIENQMFFASVARYEFPDRKYMKKFLEYVSSKLDPINHVNEIKSVVEKLLRLKTLYLIDPNETYAEWREFIHHTNLLKFCKEMFSANFTSAQLIWARHSSSILPYATIQNLTSVIDSVPETLKPFDIIQWLKHFAPNVLQIYPNFMTQIVSKSISKTKSLQHSPYWPDIGLEFMNNVDEILGNIKFLNTNIQRRFETCTERIKDIIIALEDLSVLKKSYHLIIPMDDYIRDSVEDTAFNLLQHVQLSNFKALVNDFLYPIFKEKGMSPESCIMRYIVYLTTNKNYTDWPERAVVAIEFLNNENEKLTAILSTLKAAPVPWPAVLNPLVKHGDGSHPLAQEIYVEFKSQSIKILKKKYGWPLDIPVKSLMLLVKRIISVNKSDMTKDIRTVIEYDKNIATQANTFLILMLTKQQDLEKAFDYVKNLPLDELEVSCIHCISCMLKIINESNGTDLNDITMECIKLLNGFVNGKCSPNIQNAERVLLLRKTFKMEVDTFSLYNQEKLKQLIKQGIEVIIKESCMDEKNLLNKIFVKIKKLSIALNYNLLKTILETCMYVNNNIFTLNLIALLLTNVELEGKSIPYGLELCILALKQELNTAINENNDKDSLLYPLIHYFLEKMQRKPSLHYIDIKELFQWTSIGNRIYPISVKENLLENYLKECQVTKDMIFKEDVLSPSLKDAKEIQRESLSMFEEVSTPTESTTNIVLSSNDIKLAIKCLSLAIKCVIITTELSQSVLQSCSISYTKDLDTSLEDDIIQELTNNLEKLLKTKHYMVVFMILQQTLQYEKQSQIFLPNVRKVFIKKILKTIITQKQPNYSEAITVLLSDSDSLECLNTLKDILKAETYIINYYVLLEKYFIIIKNENEAAQAKKSRMLYQYHQELISIDSSFKYKQNLDFSSMQNLLKDIKGSTLSIELLQKMSNEFVWNYEESISYQILAYLAGQKIEFETKIDVFGKEELVVKNNPDEMLKICQPYINEIVNRSVLAEILKQHIKQFNFYFYEVYLCAIKILRYIDLLPIEMQLWENILMFLVQFPTIRKNRPSQVEHDWWFQGAPDEAVLPKISKYRLPFYPMIAEPLKNILDDEICVENCERWLPLIQLISNLKTIDAANEVEYFIMSAVKKSISERKSSTEETGVWHLTETNNAFLQMVLRLITHMQAKPKIAFTLYFVTNNSPEGIDQIQAAYECYAFVLKHEKELIVHPKAQEIVRKIKDKYPIWKIHHILHLYGLAEERFMKLASDPNKLIHELYYHESIIQDQKIDINRVVEEIASLHSLNCERIQSKLVNKWLRLELGDASTTNVDGLLLDQSIRTSTTCNGGEGDTMNDESVLRAYFILKSWDTSKAMSFLIYEILQKQPSTNTGKELQLVECYTKLAENSDTIDEMITPEYYSTLKCVHNMTELGYKISKDKFESVEKLSLLKQIWKKHADNPKALELITYICVGSDIYEVQIWNGVLKQMIALGMMQHLETLVVILSVRTELLHSSGLASAWTAVIKAPFKYATKMRSNEQEAKLAKALIHLQSCPVSGRLSFIELTEICLRINRPHIAAIFAVHANDDEKKQILKMIKTCESATLKEDIQELKDHGILPAIVNTALKLLKE